MRVYLAGPSDGPAAADWPPSGKSQSMTVAGYRDRRTAYAILLDKIPAADLSWFAGWLCADGCIADSGGGRPAVKFRLTDRDPLDRFAALFGNTVRGPFPPIGVGRKELYTWFITGWRADMLIERLRAWLSVRYNARADAINFTPREHCGQKFNPTQVADIKARIAVGSKGISRRLAAELGVSNALIYAIRSGRLWADVEAQFMDATPAAGQNDATKEVEHVLTGRVMGTGVASPFNSTAVRSKTTAGYENDCAVYAAWLEQIPEVDIAWFSGWLCADGSIGRIGRGVPYLRFAITDLDPLDRFSELLGGTTSGPMPASGFGIRPRYVWRLAGWRVPLILERTRPWLSQRYLAKFEALDWTYAPPERQAQKLTPDLVREIRIRLESGKHGIARQLAREYGVTDSMICRIRSGKAWIDFHSKTETKVS